MEFLDLYLADIDTDDLKIVFEYLKTYKLGYGEFFHDPALWRSVFDAAMTAAKKSTIDQMREENRARKVRELEEPRLTDEDRDIAMQALRGLELKMTINRPEEAR